MILMSTTLPTTIPERHGETFRLFHAIDANLLQEYNSSMALFYFLARQAPLSLYVSTAKGVA